MNCKAFFDLKLEEIFVVGGGNHTQKAITECERFNLVKRTSVMVSPLGTGRSSPALVNVKNSKGENRLIVIGGTDDEGNYIKSIESIDFSLGHNGKWEWFDVELPVGLSRLEARSTNNKI